ncbi:hypothetical protein KBC75_06080 [Candidatus Shapirobacteria bacterium]|nr:hypothetical protein [Candidatus Shapirobacteria bacterium]
MGLPAEYSQHRKVLEDAARARVKELIEIEFPDEFFAAVNGFALTEILTRRKIGTGISRGIVGISVEGRARFLNEEVGIPVNIGAELICRDREGFDITNTNRFNWPIDKESRYHRVEEELEKLFQQ